MTITITSKNNEQTFNDASVINIGNAQNCQFKINPGFELLLSLQKIEGDRWQIVNNFKSDKVLFRGQPIGASIKIGSLCKLMIADTDEFISIKITAGGTNPKVVPGSLELANRKNAERIKRTEHRKTLKMIEEEDLDERDIESLYGSGAGVQAKIKIDKLKADIERRRALVIKEIAYKAAYLKQKLAQNELILSALNIFTVVIPLIMAYVLRDIIVVVDSKNLQSKILFCVAVVFITITLLLKQGQFLFLQNKTKSKATASSVLIQRMSMMVSGGVFGIIIFFSLVEMLTGKYNLPTLVVHMLILCSVICIILGIFAGFTKNIIAESGEELDSYESREDFQAVVKDYQQWITLFVNNIGRKKLKDINGKIFNLQIKGCFEYLLGFLTAPFLAYGVSQTLAECFPEAAAWVRLSAGFKFSPIFLVLATLMICFAFHCFSTSFATAKRMNAANIIKQDGFSDYNVHGVVLHGVESCKHLKKEAKKFFLIAAAVVVIELTMNMSYFSGVMGGDMMGLLLSIIAALVPTAILIMETNMLGNTKFEIIVREELLEKVDKDY